jgi:hypothetical protein
MDDEIFEIAKENDLTLDEAKELENFIADTGLDAEEAFEVWDELER